MCTSINRHHIDKQTRKYINKSLRTATACHFKLDDVDVKNDINNYILWARDYSGEINTHEAEDQDIIGVVINLNLEQNFGFIESVDGQRYHFRKREVDDPTNWEKDLISKSVIFDTKKEKKGDTAINIRLLE